MSNALPLDGSHIDIITILEADHRAATALLARVEGAAPEERAAPFPELLRFLVAHEMAEEQVLYPALRVVTNQTEPMIQQRLEEQREAEDLLRRLEEADPSSPELGSLFGRLRQAVRAHAEAEELEVLPLLAELEQALDRPGMGARYVEAKRRAPTHPHPDAPDRPPGNLVAGPLVGLVDRVRDAFR